MANPTLLQNYNAAVKRTMRNKIIQQKTQKPSPTTPSNPARVLGNESGSMVGLEDPYKRGVPFGETALNPLRRQTSFEPMVAPKPQRCSSGCLAASPLKPSGFTKRTQPATRSPEGESDFRRDVVLTYYQHQNWYSIGPGREYSRISRPRARGLHSFSFDNVALAEAGRRLAPPGGIAGTEPERILYQAVDEPRIRSPRRSTSRRRRRQRRLRSSSFPAAITAGNAWSVRSLQQGCTASATTSTTLPAASTRGATPRSTTS